MELALTGNTEYNLGKEMKIEDRKEEQQEPNDNNNTKNNIQTVGKSSSTPTRIRIIL